MKYQENELENFIKNVMEKIDIIWAMFKIYLNNPNHIVYQDDILARLFMNGEHDVGKLCHTLGIYHQRDLTFGELLKQCKIL